MNGRTKLQYSKAKEEEYKGKKMDPTQGEVWLRITY